MITGASSYSIRQWVRLNPVKSTASIGFVVQATRSSATLLTMPAILADLGQERFAVWLIALSLIGIIGVFNAGLNATVITLTGRVPIGDHEAICRIACAAYIVAATWGIIIALILIPIFMLVDWQYALHLRPNISSIEVQWLLVVLVASLSLGSVTAVPRQIMFGQQRGYLTHTLDIVGLLLAAVAVAGDSSAR